MKNDTNFDNNIKELFDRDGLQAPSSLDEEAVYAMLEGIPQESSAPDTAAPGTQERTTVTRRRRWFRPALALAACFCLVLGIGAAQIFGPSGAPANDTAGTSETAAVPEEADTIDPAVLFADSGADEFGLLALKDYKELDRLMASLIPDEGYYPVEDYYLEDAEESARGTGAAKNGDVATAEDTGGSAPAHSGTYTQVEGIDEADIIKTDGRYIYFVSSFDNRINIVGVKDGKTKKISSVSGDRCGTFISDLYITGDRLIVLGELDNSGFSLLAPFDRAATVVTVFDITDRNAPEQIRQYEQSGTCLTSRMNGNMLYLVTNDYMYTYKKGHCCPCIAEDGGKWSPLAIEDIRYFPEAASPAFTVVGAIDVSKTADDADSVSTKAVLGGSGEIFCSSKALYITTTFYPGDVVSAYAYQDMSCKTRVLKLSLDQDAPSYAGTAIVNGSINDQFSMDDSRGIFKIATTSQKNGQDVNNLFLLDEDMQLTGSLRNFAKDEHIEAARYIKDKAYIITYEQTDPLFIIDLSDPYDPEIEGHVKISGFSTLLVPTPDEYLLGLGFSTETNEWGEATDGLKLALFDIHDPAAPAVSDSKSFEGMNSQVQYDHKALLVGPDAAWYAVPYENWNYDEETNEYKGRNGILVFSAKDGKLQIEEQFRTADSVRRALYIDGYVYGVLYGDTIESFAIPAGQ